MIFPVLSKFDAKWVKKVSLCARDNVRYEHYKHSRASNFKVIFENFGST